MMSIPTQPMAISPATAGVPEAPPGPSGDPSVSFAAIIAPFTAAPVRQGGIVPGKALPVAPPLDPKPDDRAIETAAVDSAGESPEGDDDDRPVRVDDSDYRMPDPVLAWFIPSPVPVAQSLPSLPATEAGDSRALVAAPASPQLPPPAFDDTTVAVPVSGGVTVSAPLRFDPVLARLDRPVTPTLTRDRADTPADPAAPIVSPIPVHPALAPRPEPAFDAVLVAQILPFGRDVGPAQPRARTEASILADATLVATATMLPQAVAPVATADQAPLDMTRHGWPQAMIDRIEALRDNADAADTRIRIVPDALGTIDVSVRRQGEITHVHFAADQAQTRHILADAQPRLAEFAESRGLKLAQASVDSGTGQQQRHQPAAFVSRAPVRAHRSEAATDHRIA